MGMPKRSRRSKLGGFTLLEMMIAMGILAFMMLVLFKFFANVQDAWTQSMNTTELYENGRVVLDVITRDLQASIAKADDIPGQDILFCQPDASSLWFITASDPSSEAHSSLMEVGYRLNDRQFERAFVDDSDTEWNVYGARDDAHDQGGYQRVIPGVISQEFICYDSSTDDVRTPGDASMETALPSMISVVLKLMDSKSFKLWERLPTEKQLELEKKASRTFRKTVYLGNQ